ncbi:hypothetical protein A3K63_04490 [Candidatus Micrarchaeota archaeon RBG_16_49_10]|nr:MAG: hypothetical protein A3K63_04490 [Candidatus Micrarchaeota archaeon RBG_16_49_10]
MSVFVDVNIFVELFLEQEKQKECFDFFELINKNKLKAYTSDFIIFGSSLILERSGKKPSEIKKFLEDVFNIKGLTVYDLTPSDMINATKNMKNYNLSLEDAFSLQGALENKIKDFVSFDRDFDKVKIIKRVEPKDFI